MEILHCGDTIESRTNSTLCYSHSQELFMMCQPLLPPERPDVLPEDETLSEVSDQDLEVVEESDQDKAACLKKNRNKLARKHRAEHCKEAMRRYQVALTDYEDELARM
jgi:hypothetical protein